MGWEDRDYNRGGGGAEDYLSNPGAILGLSVPFGTWLGARVRLHFWLLLVIVIRLAGLLRGGSPLGAGLYIALLLVALLMHDFGHRLFTRWVGGHHDEFMLWPYGGMIFPRVPPGAWPLFVGHVGGIAVNAVLAVVCLLATGARVHWLDLFSHPLGILDGSAIGAAVDGAGGHTLLVISLLSFALINLGILAINFLPYYWFDGGFLAQSLLWPFLGAYRAISIVCIFGMILAVPMFALSLSGGDIFGMVMWVFLFSSAYTKRRQLQADGTGELESAIAYSAGQSGPAASPRRRKWMQPNFAKEAARKAAQERKEQEKIDAILAKVSEKGMHSLTWGEKRTLQKATERQRRHE